MTPKTDHTPPKYDCVNCNYFVGERTEYSLGECRRYAPRPRVAEISYEAQQEAWWPIVAQGEWCGEFHPAPLVYKKETNDKESN